MSSTSAKVFVDTNVLVYSLDRHDPDKQNRAREVLRHVVQDASGVISTQVLQELYVTATRKLDVDPVQAKGILTSLENLEVVTVDPPLIKEAIDCSILSQLSFWDALIIAAAESARCGIVYTEDLNEGQIIRGVRIENPLRS